MCEGIRTSFAKMSGSCNIWRGFMRHFTTFILAACLCLGLSAAARAADHADHVYINGTWYPLTESQEHVLLVTDASVGKPELTAAFQKAGVSAAVKSLRTTLEAGRALVELTPNQGKAAWLSAFKGLSDVQAVQPVMLLNGVPLWTSGELMAELAPGATYAKAKAVFSHFGLNVVEVSGLIKVRNSDATVLDTDLAAKLMAYGSVFKWVEPNFIHVLTRRHVPNDTYYADQWHLNNTGRWFSDNSGTSGSDIHAEDAWDISMGSADVKIAIIDDGVDIAHPDLAAKIVAKKDVLGNDNDPTPPAGNDSQGEPWGHGTSVAGCAAAIGDNNLGVIGSCPNCSIIGVRLIGDTGVSDATVRDTFEWACDQGAAVINNSWGYTQSVPLSGTMQYGIDYCTGNGRGGLGTVFTWAAGNESRALQSTDMECYANIVAVCATTETDAHASYSNTGACLDVCAPSNGGQWEIVTTDVHGSNGYNNNGNSALYNGYQDMDSAGNYTAFFGGTSAASPITAGVAGLIISVNPNLTYMQVINILRNTADKVGGTSAYNSSGVSTQFGYGRINAYKALQSAAQGGCGDVTAAGKCVSKTAMWCENNTLKSDNCGDKNQLCQLNASNQYRCAACTVTANSCHDGIDNNCDGSIDEAAECSADECLPGSFSNTCSGLTYVTCGSDGKITTTNCDDGDPCTADSCSRTGGCKHTNATDCTTCQDGAGVCMQGHCLNSNVYGDCEINNTCSVGLTVNGACKVCAFTDKRSCGTDGTCQNGTCVTGTTPADGDVDTDTTPQTDGDKDTEASDTDITCKGACQTAATAYCMRGDLCECVGGAWTVNDCDTTCAAKGMDSAGCIYSASKNANVCGCTDKSGDTDTADGDKTTDDGHGQNSVSSGGCAQGGFGGAWLLLLAIPLVLRRRENA